MPPLEAALEALGAALVDIAPPEGACPRCYEAAWVWTISGQRVCRRCLGLPPGFGEACKPRPIPEAIAVDVRRIEAEAIRLGWSKAELWQAAGWVSHLGLVALMRPGDTVEAVAADCITIRLRDGRRLRLYRRHRLQ